MRKSFYSLFLVVFIAIFTVFNGCVSAGSGTASDSSGKKTSPPSTTACIQPGTVAAKAGSSIAETADNYTYMLSDVKGTNVTTIICENLTTGEEKSLTGADAQNLFDELCEIKYDKTLAYCGNVNPPTRSVKIFSGCLLLYEIKTDYIDLTVNGEKVPVTGLENILEKWYA